MKECDLIMKGGITSGVVYPKVITELSSEYRFNSVGGTSAGAIAAGFCAAAEYNRSINSSNEGFKVLDSIPEEISPRLLKLFEPSEGHRKTFKYLLTLQKAGTLKKVFKTILNFFRIRKSLKRLPNTYYGMCTGMSADISKNIALTDWMNLWLEKSAGRLEDNEQLPDKPLTFGMLREAGVTLRTITTNLSEQTPINLPEIGFSYVKVSDVETLLPKNLVDYIASVQSEIAGEKNIHNPDKYYILPANDLMPVLLAVRLSLSFPILLTAFPIYRVDNSLWRCPDERKNPKVCWLSDGGIASNFPIHLFDSVFPSRPTFGISLGEMDECRQQPDEGKFPANRIYLPQKAGSGQAVVIKKVDGFFGFIMSIFNAAKDWQDTNQTYLPGYRERVVRLHLKADEGGLNLDMPAERIEALTQIGSAAGSELRVGFDLNEHRWRRLLSAYSAMELAFEDIQQQYILAKPQSMQQFLEQYIEEFKNGSPIAQSYKPGDGELAELKTRLDALLALATNWSSNPIRDQWGGSGMPKPSSSLKITPERFVR